MEMVCHLIMPTRPNGRNARRALAHLWIDESSREPCSVFKMVTKRRWIALVVKDGTLIITSTSKKYNILACVLKYVALLINAALTAHKLNLVQEYSHYLSMCMLAQLTSYSMEECRHE